MSSSIVIVDAVHTLIGRRSDRARSSVGATGGFLMTKALHELERTQGPLRPDSMCCGGGLGIGKTIERV